ncbi:hypothetical protein [Neobacillus mesonae]|uniref:hypothetical protein n=1 Tax=Neobacillus mesonae TaxID=1193713 RepID=UPI00203CFF0A|nr:hypothetical protein [Neobacillus mesonae]MCM3570342.1 hypothetical protein [Neobacillus mesonae]
MKIHLGLEENSDRTRGIDPVTHTHSDDHWAGCKRKVRLRKRAVKGLVFLFLAYLLPLTHFSHLYRALGLTSFYRLPRCLLCFVKAIETSLFTAHTLFHLCRVIGSSSFYR